MRKYREHAKRLRTTGDGIQNPDNDDYTSENEFFECYIPADGPDSTTTPEAKSIWGMNLLFTCFSC